MRNSFFRVTVMMLTLFLFSTLWKMNILNAQTKTSHSSINVFGCLDVNATNYDARATIQAKDEYGNLLCIYASCDDIPDAEGCIYAYAYAALREDFTAGECSVCGGTPCTIAGAILGCVDEKASNYDAAATVQAVDQWDNLICTYASCTDIPDANGCVYATTYAALRHDFTAADCAGYGGTACVNASEGCMDANATNYNSDATVPGLDQYGNSVCIYTSCDDIPDAAGCIYVDAYAALREDFTAGECSGYGGIPCTITGAIQGCMDENASNYDAAATVQAVDQWGNLICTYASCTDIPDANGCVYATTYAALRHDFTAADCAGYGGTACVDASAGCMDANATNYNSYATEPGLDQYGNSVCIYTSCDDIPDAEGCIYAGAYAALREDFTAGECSGYGGTPCTIIGVIQGCMDANASNYDAAATVQAVDQWDNLICTYSSCTDIPDANGCVYATTYAALRDDFTAADCAGYGGTACVDASAGCMDANATNYNSDATVPGLDQYGNSLCIYTSCDDIPDAEGCIYIDAYAALRDDFTAADCAGYGGTACVDASAGCMDANAVNYNSDAIESGLDQYGNSLCIYTSCDDIPDAEGCIYADAYAALREDFTAGECSDYGGTACTITGAILGCMDANATNYNSDATEPGLGQHGNSVCIYTSCDDIPDAEGCIYADAYAVLREDFTAGECSGYGGTPCTIAGAILGCVDENALNYDAAATVQAVDQWDNLICTYASCTDIPDANGCVYATTYAALRHDFTAADCAGYGGNPCTDGSLNLGGSDSETTILWIKLIILFLMFYLIIRLMRRYLNKHSGNSNEIKTNEEKKYHSTLSQEECNIMMTKITSIIEKDSVYFNPEYRLNDLANSCDISVHKVSQVINHVEGVSFSDLINRYRIDEAKKMLVSEKYKTYTIVAIAHEVGFNSKTAFYNAFKKQCEISPSAYIKENKVV